MTARKAARKPAARTVAIALDGELEGWECQARVDFPASWFVELESRGLEAVLGVLDRIIVSHNFPDADGNVAARMADVDPFTALLAIVDKLGETLKHLPPR